MDNDLQNVSIDTIRNCYQKLCQYENRGGNPEVLYLKEIIYALLDYSLGHHSSDLVISDPVLYGTLRVFDESFRDLKIDYIDRRIKASSFVLLPDAIAEKKVFKVSYQGSLKDDHFENGFLSLMEDASVKCHTHYKDMEIYRLLRGSMVVGGKSLDTNICGIGESHEIERSSKLPMVETFKIDRDYLSQEHVTKLLQKIKKK